MVLEINADSLIREGKFLAHFHLTFDKASTSYPSDPEVGRTTLACGDSNLVSPPRFRVRA